ncbi:MAG: hypothetical protein HOO96_03730 [Polyangiaceae bacterium]|nr:hypothetical protein [Polyangiaceae bacterium]
MMPMFLVAALVVALLAAGAAAVSWGIAWRRGAHSAEAEGSGRVAAVTSQRDAAERRVREAQAEIARWKSQSLAGSALSEVAVFPNRPAPRDAEELALLVRGLSLVDDVVIADASGNALTRESEALSADLAALAAQVISFRRQMLVGALPVAAISFETVGASHVHARPLEGRGEGTVLMVRTTSRRVNPLVVDAVAHAATRDLTDLPWGASPIPSFTGTTQRKATDSAGYAQVFALLERELGAHLTGIVLMVEGRPVFSAAKDGPGEAARFAAAANLGNLAVRATRTLRATALSRLDVALRGGTCVSWMAVGPRSPITLVTFGPPEARSTARMDRLLGSVRRLVDPHAMAAQAEGSAA